MIFIACGWGSLLIEAAKNYKVKGLGITLSEEQYKNGQVHSAESVFKELRDKYGY